MTRIFREKEDSASSPKKKRPMLVRYSEYMDNLGSKKSSSKDDKEDKVRVETSTIKDTSIENSNEDINASAKMEETTPDKKSTTREIIWLIFNILSVGLYTAFAFVTLDFEKLKFVRGAIIVLIAFYVIVLIALIAFSRDKSKLNLRMKNYKSSVKVLKKLTSIAALVLSISVLFSSTYFSINNFFSVVYMIFMIIFSVISIVFTILTIIFRNKIEEKKTFIKQKIRENIDEFKK